MKNSMLPAAVAAALCVCHAGMAYAKDLPAMQEVIVTADRTEESAKNVTRAVTVVDGNDINHGAYTDLRDVLRHYGFDTTANSLGSGSAGSITVRGLQTHGEMSNSLQSDVMLLIDGRHAGTNMISMIPLFMIERVEILRGPSGVQYGSNGMGGVVNVITKRGGDAFRAAAEVGAGRYETYRGEMGFSGKKGIFDFAGGAAFKKQGADFKTGDGKKVRNTSLHARTDYALNVGMTPIENNRLGISLLGSVLDKAGSPGGTGFPAASSSYYPTPRDHEDRDAGSLDVVYEGFAGQWGLSWKARFFHARDKYTFYDGADNPYTPYYPYDPYSSRYKETNQGVQGQVAWKRGFFSLVGGYDFLSNTYSGDYLDGIALDGRMKLRDHAGFIMGKGAFWDDRLILSAGMRLDSYEYRYRGSQKDHHKSTYALGVAYDAFDWLTLKANYGTSFKVPVGMQVMGYSGWYAQYDGNGSLKPEEGRGWDIGFESEWQGLKLSAAYFQTDYKDKIIDVALGNGHHQFQNSGGTSRLQGIEASGSYDLGQAFSWNFSLMPYVNLTHMIKADDKDGHKLPHIRTNIIAYGLRYDHPAHGLNVDLRLLYLGHQSEKYNDAFYASQTLRTGGETTADLHITKTIWERRDGGRLNVKASLMNIFDKNYMAYYGYPQPGRTFYVGLRYEY